MIGTSVALLALAGLIWDYTGPTTTANTFVIRVFNPITPRNLATATTDENGHAFLTAVRRREFSQATSYARNPMTFNSDRNMARLNLWYGYLVLKEPYAKDVTRVALENVTAGIENHPTTLGLVADTSTILYLNKGDPTLAADLKSLLQANAVTLAARDCVNTEIQMLSDMDATGEHSVCAIALLKALRPTPGAPTWTLANRWKVITYSFEMCPLDLAYLDTLKAWVSSPNFELLDAKTFHDTFLAQYKRMPYWDISHDIETCRKIQSARASL
jgi:hypothetical protein